MCVLLSYVSYAVSGVVTLDSNLLSEAKLKHIGDLSEEIFF